MSSIVLMSVINERHSRHIPRESSALPDHWRAVAACSEDESGEHAEREASDVREHRHAAGRGRVVEREAALPGLEREPQAEEPDRGDLPEPDDPEEDHREHPCTRKEDEV